VIKYDDLVLERKYLLKELSNPTMDEELKKFLQHRLERIEFQIKSRNQASGDKMFQGLFSYYIGVLLIFNHSNFLAQQCLQRLH